MRGSRPSREILSWLPPLQQRQQQLLIQNIVGRRISNMCRVGGAFVGRGRGKQLADIFCHRTGENFGPQHMEIFYSHDGDSQQQQQQQQQQQPLITMQNEIPQTLPKMVRSNNMHCIQFPIGERKHAI